MDRPAVLLALGAAAAAAAWIAFRASNRRGNGFKRAGSGGGGAAVLASALDTTGKATKSNGVPGDEDGHADQHPRPAAAVPSTGQPQQQAEAVAAAARQALSRVTRNELIVHDMLLTGKEGDLPFLPPLDGDSTAAAPAAPARMSTGRTPASPAPAAGPAPGESLAALTAPAPEVLEVQQAVVGTIERAFFDALADGLRRGETDRLAALLLDARDQLAALLPQSAAAAQHPHGGTVGGVGEGQALLAELMEQLDGEYVQQRLQRYDAAYCAQAFDLLVNAIARLQAPARRASTREQYAAVAALFAAAAQADSQAPAADRPEPHAAGVGAGAAGAAPSSAAAAAAASAEAAAAAPTSAAEPRVMLHLTQAGNGVSASLVLAADVLQGVCREPAQHDGPGRLVTAEGGGAGRVQLHLSCQGDEVAVRLASPPAPATPNSEAAPLAGGADVGADVGAELSWALHLVPSRSGDGSVSAVMVPVGSLASTSSPRNPEGPSSSDSSRSGGAVSEASAAAVVAAAQFMRRQLSELRADVAAAHLALLKEAILGSGSGVDYERQRYTRAMQAATGVAAGAAPAAAATMPDGAQADVAASEAGDVVAQAVPVTHAWLRQVLLQAPPPPPASPHQPDVGYSRACVSAGLLLLLQRPQAVGVADCPETLLLDLGAIVAVQNEMQRLCLLAASLLIVRQILAHTRALPPAGSPEHEQLSRRVLRRMGALLSSGPPMEALVLELHQQVQQAMSDKHSQERVGQATAVAQAQPPGEQAEQAGAGAVAMGGQALAGEAAQGGQPGEPVAQEQGSQQGSQEGSQEGAAVPAAQAPAPAQQEGVEVALVRRMVTQIFSTEHTAYQRVQAGIVAAATSLFRAAGASSAPGGTSPAGSPGQGGAAGAAGSASWRLTLRGIGAELLAPEVHRLASALDRIAAVSAAVAHAPVYAPLLAGLLQEQTLQQAALQRRRH